MFIKIIRIYKKHRQLKQVYSLVFKVFKAGGWLYGVYKKRALNKQQDVHRRAAGKQERNAYATPGFKSWTPPESAKPYLQSIQRAEQEQRLPPGVLTRLIYQECRFREDIICGKVVSSAGAVGIAQIVPRWHPEARPLDPEHSIFYAARYLAQMNRQFNDWPAALAAYNWGPGNVSKARRQHGRNWLDNAPKETRDYVSQIGRDTGLL